MIKKIAALILIGVFSSAMFAQDLKPVSLTIPTGTPIAARLVTGIDSGLVKEGDVVTLDVLEDLTIEGLVVIPRGAVVTGHVTKAKGARVMGRGGQLDISFDSVTAGDGTKVPVSGERFAKGKGGYGGGSAAGAAAAGLLFPPAAALLLLKHGHASEIPAGTVLTLNVTADTSVVGVVAKPTVAAAPAIAHAPKSETQMVVISASGAQPLSTEAINSAAVAAQPESLGDASRRMKAEKAAQR